MHKLPERTQGSRSRGSVLVHRPERSELPTAARTLIRSSAHFPTANVLNLTAGSQAALVPALRSQTPLSTRELLWPFAWRLPHLLFLVLPKVWSAKAFPLLGAIPTRLAGRCRSFAQTSIIAWLLLLWLRLVRHVRSTKVLAVLGGVLAGLSVFFGRLTARGQRSPLFRDIHELLPGSVLKLVAAFSKSWM